MSAQSKLKLASELGVGAKLSPEEVKELVVWFEKYAIDTTMWPDTAAKTLRELEGQLAEANAKAEIWERNYAACGDSLYKHHRKKMDEFAETAKENHRLRAALEPIVRLMTSMQSMGYFTNDEWQARLAAGQLALSPEGICPECQLKLDSNSEIWWCENGHVYRLPLTEEENNANCN